MVDGSQLRFETSRAGGVEEIQIINNVFLHSFQVLIVPHQIGLLKRNACLKQQNCKPHLPFNIGKRQKTKIVIFILLTVRSFIKTAQTLRAKLLFH